MRINCDPFQLFPRQVENAALWEYGGAPGVENRKVADLRVIVKRVTGSDMPGDYGSRITTHRVHVQTSTLPVLLAMDPDKLISHVLETQHGRYIITGVSRGDDMTEGATRFVTMNVRPYNRRTM